MFKALKKIEWLSEEEHVNIEGGKYYINKFKITYYNDVVEEIEIYDKKDKAIKLLEELDFDEQVLESLSRFAEDEERDEEEGGYTWDRLYNIVADKNMYKLSDEDWEDITLCVRICTVFDKFNYKDYIAYKEGYIYVHSDWLI